MYVFRIRHAHLHTKQNEKTFKFHVQIKKTRRRKKSGTLNDSNSFNFGCAVLHIYFKGNNNHGILQCFLVFVLVAVVLLP